MFSIREQVSLDNDGYEYMEHSHYIFELFMTVYYI